MSSIDDAIARIQAIVLSSSDTAIKSAPDYPISDASALPLCITHIEAGEVEGYNSTTTRVFANISVDVHFPRISLKETYQKIDALAIELPRRLHGDVTLNGTVDTIVFPITFSVSPARWDKVVTQMLSFKVKVKTLETPIT